ncbi:MAG: hypothetical protein JW953_19255 [Anaerolineae bacterium]|nr:hypothetical protein [Anaerolineae bacterium]
MPQEINQNNQADLTDKYPELSPEPTDKRPLIYGIIAAVIVILLFGGIGVGLFFWEHTPLLRDIFIIYLGLGVFVIILLLIALIVIIAYLVIKVNDLVQLLDREIKPMLTKLQETTGTIRGTATFLSDRAVQPVITTVSTVSAIKAIFRSLFRR